MIFEDRNIYWVKELITNPKSGFYNSGFSSKKINIKKVRRNAPSPFSPINPDQYV